MERVWENPEANTGDQSGELPYTGVKQQKHAVVYGDGSLGGRVQKCSGCYNLNQGVRITGRLLPGDRCGGNGRPGKWRKMARSS